MALQQVYFQQEPRLEPLNLLKLIFFAGIFKGFC